MLKNMNAKTLLGSTVGVAIIAGYAVMQDLGSDFTFFFDTAMPFAAADATDKIPAIQINTRHHYHQRLATQLATGEGAGGVVAVDARFVGAFVNARRFENLSDPAYDAAALAGGRADQAWQQGQDAKGNQYAIPVNVGPRVMYYRRDVLASIGAEIDDVVGSWESYIDYGRALKDQGIYLVGDAADAADVIINASIQDGAIPKEADDKQAAWGFIQYLLDSEETTLSGLKTTGACTVVKGALDSVNVDAEMARAESQYARGPPEASRS